jgi:class 3 adenylate cyclase/tetratricopeptide (TPR) repeat protein
METLATYIPIDRYRAIVQNKSLPEHTRGAALFVDVSGFTPLTETLLNKLGPRRGAEELTHQLNQVYDALIPKIHAYQGSVITFSGDALICWFDGDDGLRAVACGLALQHIIERVGTNETPSGVVVSLAMKVAIAAGSVRRLLIGDPLIQVMDVIAGATLDRVSAAEQHAQKGEVLLDAATAHMLGSRIQIAEWRTNPDTGEAFARIERLTHPLPATAWPALDMPPVALHLDTRAWVLPPLYERLSSGQEQFLAEIRPAVVLFLRFGGIDYHQDAEAGAHLDAYIRWVQNVLAKYEGFLLQVIMGDKGSYLYASFGAPLAHDDDSARAVAAALDLLELPPELSYIHGIQAGISRGLMHAGAYGSSTRHTYGVLGDEVNLAARLMARAEPGQILVTGRIAHSIEHIYHLTPGDMLQLKGKKDPVPVSLVLGRRQTKLQGPTAQFPDALIGRDAELAAFDAALAQSQRGSGQIVRLEGVAGIGKSHLTAAFGERAQRQRVRVVLGACQSISRNIAYAPWRQIFETLLNVGEQRPGGQASADSQEQIARLEAQIAGWNPDWLLRLPLLGDLLGLPIPDNATTATFDPRLRQEALFALVIDLLRTWSHDQPMLLLLEDVHWIDEASRDLTLALSRVIGSMPVLLTLVHRPPVQENRPILPELLAMSAHHYLPLGELTPEAVTVMVTERLRAPASALTLSLVQSQAQGNPFFIEELLDALRESGKLIQHSDGTWGLADSVIHALSEAQCIVKNDAGEAVLAANASLSAAEIGIPDSIHGIVLSRLDRLPEEYKVTLKVASVIGRIFDVAVLAQVHPARPERGALIEQIRECEIRDFTRLELPPPHLTYIFKHSVTQEVAYETLLESQRRDLHSAVGATLERLQPDAVEQIAYHYSRSGVRDKTLFYLDKAAHKTQREHANETALSYYNQALALEEHWPWRRGQVEVLHTLGRREEQHAALTILSSTPDVPIFTSSYLWGQYYEAVGDYTHAQAIIEQALTTAHNHSDRMGRARCLTQLGLITYRQADYEPSRAWYEHVLATFAEQPSSSDEETQTYIEALNGLGHIYRQRGDFEQAQASFEQALELSRSSGHRKGEADALNNLGIVARYQRQFPEALAYYQQSLDLQRAIGDRAGEGASLGNLAQVIQGTGDYGQAETYLSRALEIQRAIGNRWNEINTWTDLGVLYQELGDLERAHECLQQGLALSQEIGDEAGQAYILANLGLVVHDQGDLQRARNLLTEGLRLAQPQDDAYLVAGYFRYLSSVSLRMQHIPTAIEQAQTALRMQRELDLHLDTSYDLATLAMAYQIAGEMSQALDYARQALAVLAAYGSEGPEFPQRDYLLCSQVLAAAGEDAAARDALHAASSLVLARADKILDPALRQSFLERVPINHQIVRAMNQAG